MGSRCKQGPLHHSVAMTWVAGLFSGLHLVVTKSHPLSWPVKHVTRLLCGAPLGTSGGRGTVPLSRCTDLTAASAQATRLALPSGIASWASESDSPRLPPGSCGSCTDPNSFHLAAFHTRDQPPGRCSLNPFGKGASGELRTVSCKMNPSLFTQYPAFPPLFLGCLPLPHVDHLLHDQRSKESVLWPLPNCPLGGQL